MKKSTRESAKSLSRRRVLAGVTATGAGALPFVLAVPSNAHNVVTDNIQRADAAAREAAYRERVSLQLAQATRPLPPGAITRPLPPPRRPTINTSYSTPVGTPSYTDTFSGTPEKADDVKTETYSDGSKSDYKTDYAD